MKTQATRTIDLIRQQKERRQRRELMLSIPVICIAATVFAYAIVGFAA
jgi:hypothetical protein